MSNRTMEVALEIARENAEKARRDGINQELLESLKRLLRTYGTNQSGPAWEDARVIIRKAEGRL